MLMAMMKNGHDGFLVGIVMASRYTLTLKALNDIPSVNALVDVY
jgi:hypothetical protein